MDSSSLKILEENPQQINETEVATVILKTESPIVYEKFSDLEELGRFVLTDKGEVVAGGIIK